MIRWLEQLFETSLYMLALNPHQFPLLETYALVQLDRDRKVFQFQNSHAAQISLISPWTYMRGNRV